MKRGRARRRGSAVVSLFLACCALSTGRKTLGFTPFRRDSDNVCMYSVIRSAGAEQVLARSVCGRRIHFESTPPHLRRGCQPVLKQGENPTEEKVSREWWSADESDRTDVVVVLKHWSSRPSRDGTAAIDSLSTRGRHVASRMRRMKVIPETLLLMSTSINRTKCET